MTTRRTLTKVAALGAVVAVLAGCRIIGPEFDQTFANRTTPVPLKAVTVHAAHPVQFECHQAFHGGLYPAFGPQSWVPVTNVTPVPNGDYFSAETRRVLPASCWHQDYHGVWYSAVRARQRDTNGVLPAEGFPSLKQYSNSSTFIPWVRIKATS